MTFLAEGQFIPRRNYIIVAGTPEEAEQRLQDFLDKNTKLLNQRQQRNPPMEYRRASYTLTPLPTEAGVYPLALWHI